MEDRMFGRGSIGSKVWALGMGAIALTTISATNAVAASGPSKKELFITAGTSTAGANVEVRIVKNDPTGLVNNCDTVADILQSGTVVPAVGGRICPAPMPVGPPPASATLQTQFNTPVGSFPNLTSCVAGSLSIQRIGDDPRGQWDVCVFDTTTNAWVKVLGQVPSVPPFDAAGVPQFTTVVNTANAGGITITGNSKGKHAVPALSLGGAAALSALMIGFAGFMIRRNRRNAGPV